MDSSGQRILVVLEVGDAKARYMTAKKLAQLFPQRSFSEWKTKLDAGGPTVVMRSEDESEFDPFRRSIEMFGAETAIIDQKTIGGAKVY